MKFLLLNDNPVVNKLVTLSAQKTGDELVVAEGREEIHEADYDLLIIDHAVYSNALLDELQEKITYRRALFIAHRGEEVPEGFDKVINKPFLPTDLVEFFSEQIVEASDDILPDLDNDESEQEEILLSAEEAVLPELEEEEPIEELELDLDFSDDIFEMEDEKIEDLSDEALLPDLDEGFDLDDLDELAELDELEGGVLDEDELHEVQELLDDTDLREAAELLREEKVAGLKQETMDEVNDVLADFYENETLEIDDEFIDDLLIEDEENEYVDIADKQTDEVESDEAMGELELLSTDEPEVAEERVAASASEEENVEESLSDDVEKVSDESLSVLPSEEESSQNRISEDMSATAPIDAETEEAFPDDLEESDDELSELTEELSQTMADNGSGSSVEPTEEPDDFDITDETIAPDEDLATMDSEIEIDLGEIGSLEEEIENAVSSLSEEELDQDVDESLLLDIVSSSTDEDDVTVPEESNILSESDLIDDSEERVLSAGFEEFDTLNELDLKIALGEAEESSREEKSESSDVEENMLTPLSQDDTLSEEKLFGGSIDTTIPGTQDGLEELHALTKVLKKMLKDESASAALQGMKINVNITFGDKN